MYHARTIDSPQGSENNGVFSHWHLSTYCLFLTLRAVATLKSIQLSFAAFTALTPSYYLKHLLMRCLLSATELYRDRKYDSCPLWELKLLGKLRHGPHANTNIIKIIFCDHPCAGCQVLLAGKPRSLAFHPFGGQEGNSTARILLPVNFILPRRELSNSGPLPLQEETE
jgi:hypothetical protein